MTYTAMVSNIPLLPVWSHRFQVNPKNGRNASMISEETYKVVKENATILDSTIIYDRDFNYNLCVFSTVTWHLVINPAQFWFQNA